MKQLTGILLIAISAASFGTLAIFGRFLYAEGMDIFTVLFLRFGLAALSMAIILVVCGETLPRGKILLQLMGMGGGLILVAVVLLTRGELEKKPSIEAPLVE
jgi:drug/metabolite transporter (DMT)-like permease